MLDIRCLLGYRRISFFIFRFAEIRRVNEPIRGAAHFASMEHRTQFQPIHFEIISWNASQDLRCGPALLEDERIPRCCK